MNWRGRQRGQNDAANLLKPALARGKTANHCRHHLVGVQEYFEKDPALARRFRLSRLKSRPKRLPAPCLPHQGVA